MPAAKNAHLRIDTKKILLTTNGLAEAAGCHHATPLTALAKGQIDAEAWVDYRGKLSPLFAPSAAIVLAKLRAGLIPHDIPPTIS